MLRRTLALLALTTSTLAQCPEWSTAYVPPGADSYVFAVEHHDDGAGERLYVGGVFQRIGAQSISSVARWTGTAFESIGQNLGSISRLQSLDDGSGAALYATVSANGSVWRWDGTIWNSLPVGSGRGELEVFDDGAGAALYVAGAGSTGRSVRRLNGGTWVDVGTPFNNAVQALEVFDDGTGPALYAAGSFRSWNGAPCVGVARWTGSAWVQVGAGLGQNGLHSVTSLLVHDDGSGRRLIAGGFFPVSGAVPIDNVAAWDGSAWSSLGAGVGGTPRGALWTPVRALQTAVIGGVPRLIAAGDLDEAEGTPVQLVAVWDGTAWVPLGTGVGHANTPCCTYDGIYALSASASGALVAGGYFARAGDAGARNLARWDGANWSGLVAGESLAGTVRASTIHDDGTGNRIYVAGALKAAGNEAASLVARFDGTTWERVGPHALDSREAQSLASIDFGSGPHLYVGGTYLLAAWDGSQWTDVPGLSGPQPNSYVTVGALLADSNSSLYAGGTFTQIGGVAANGIARFDGQTWQPLGAGLGGVRSLAFFDSGAGRELYAGGDFPGRIARWDGATWVFLPQPPAGNGGAVVAMQAYSDGTSACLFIGGAFTSVGGTTTFGIASWNGASWTTYGQGAGGYTNVHVRTFRVFDDGLGAGPRLFAGGYFASIQDQSGFSLSAWDGSTWQSPSPGGGVDGTVVTLEGLEDGNGASLFVFGDFDSTNAGPAWNLARCGRDGTPGCEPTTGAVDCDGDGVGGGTACPCANTGGTGRGCDNSSATGGARLSALGQANVRADTVTLHVEGMPGSTMCLFFQGTSTVAGGAGSVFGDGVRCVGGTQIRLAIRAASGGVARFGAEMPGDPELSEAGGISDAAARSYQVWYRDAQTFCSSSTFNLSNGLRLRWAY